ncbi:MAG: addiction module protein [Flavobacterium sp.]|nr:addiction module protein [Flavobacterium sp.]
MCYNKEALLQLSAEEKISLVTELWDSIDQQKTDVPEWKKALITERLTLDKANSNGGIEWHVLKNKYAR